MKTGAVTALPVATLAQKCVWTADEKSLYCAVPRSFGGNLPDDWYQGTASFADRLWRIDLSGRVATLVVDLSGVSGASMDAVGLALDPASKALAFMNKRDGSFWVYSF